MSFAIQKCDETHREALVAFFNRDYYYSLFFIGNLQAMGFAHPDLEYWGGFVNEEPVAVLMRYLENWALFAVDESLDLAPLVQLIDTDRFERLHGKPWIVDQVVQGLSGQVGWERFNNDYFCALDREDFNPGRQGVGVRKGTLEDADEIDVLYRGGEMAHVTGEKYRKRLTDLGNRCFVVEADGQIVSAAMTSVETPMAAMIGSVYTPAAMRGHGYASMAVSALCAELLAEGKQPCLFYDNPSAGVIYRRLGFHDIGLFKMATPERR